MRTVCARHWCLLFSACVLMSSVFGLKLSPLTSAAHRRASRRPLSIEQPPEVAKRPNRAFGSFYRLMQRHSRYLDEQAFAEKMFRLFDMNADNLIERDEFLAILQLLGLISHS